MQFLPSAQPRINVLRGITAVLSAVVPADQLDGADAVARAFFTIFNKVGIRNMIILLRRVDLQLLPGIHILDPIRNMRRLEPRRPPLLVAVNARVPVAIVTAKNHRRQLHGRMRMSENEMAGAKFQICLLYTSPSP